MKEYVELGPVPCDEEASQTNAENFTEENIKECRRYKELLESKFPEYPDAGCYFSIKSNPHEFGTYREVAINFDDKNETAGVFASEVENNLPKEWSDTTPVMLLEKIKKIIDGEDEESMA